jgi:hypothetical protein
MLNKLQASVFEVSKARRVNR